MIEDLLLRMTQNLERIAAAMEKGNKAIEGLEADAKAEKETVALNDRVEELSKTSSALKSAPVRSNIASEKDLAKAERKDLVEKAKTLGINNPAKMGQAALVKAVDAASTTVAEVTALPIVGRTVEVEVEPVTDIGFPSTEAVEAPVEPSFGFESEESPVIDTLNPEQLAKAIELLRRFLAKYAPTKGKEAANKVAGKILSHFGAKKVSEIKAADYDNYLATLAKNGISI